MSYQFGQFASRTNGGAVPPSAVGPYFDVNRINATQGGAINKELSANPDRFALWFPNSLAAGNFYFSFFYPAGSQEMATVGTPENPYVLTYREVGPLITFPVYCVYNGFGTNYYFYEIAYKPNR